MNDFHQYTYRKLINTIIYRNYEDLSLKMIGVLNDIKLDQFNNRSPEFLEFLIEKNVYIDKTSRSNEHVDDVFENPEYSQIDFDCLDEFAFNDKIYENNEMIINEVYHVTKYVIYNYMKIEFKKDIDDIKCELLGFIDIKDRLKFLKKRRKSFFTPSSGSGDFILYLNTMGSGSGEEKEWKNKITAELVFDSDFIRFYLTGFRHEDLENGIFYSQTFKEWVWFTRKFFLIDFCDNEINLLNPLKTKNSLNESNSKNPSIISTNIFIDNHYFLFKYIVNNYDDLKNKAFFSYLFHYFSDNKYLLKNIKSSTKYKCFLIQNKFIDNFSKVIQRNHNQVGDEEKRMFNIFNVFRDKFYSKKIEEKLKKN